MNESKPVIALDADGVLLDYNLAFADAWQRAFGVRPRLHEPRGYGPIERWGVELLDGARLEQLRRCFDEHFWSTIPPVAGAVLACRRLAEAGYTLVCVTALEPRLAPARCANLWRHGFAVQRVVAVGKPRGAHNPKAAAIAALAPVAFVDDYLPYLVGLPEGVHAALVQRDPIGSPNTGEDLRHVHSTHRSLAGFARWWLRRARVD